MVGVEVRTYCMIETMILSGRVTFSVPKLSPSRARRGPFGCVTMAEARDSIALAWAADPSSQCRSSCELVARYLDNAERGCLAR